MGKRIVFFGAPYYLRVSQRQLIAEPKKQAPLETEEQRIPIEDMGFLVLEHPQIVFTQQLMQVLMEEGVGVVCCDAKYMPAGMWLPLSGHHLQSERFRAQIEASEPLKKSLWKQTVQAKIRHQGLLVKAIGEHATPFETIARRVKSGDVGGEESYAARCYWPLLFGKTFKRERTGGGPNALLNYGYAILRAAVARALVATGLFVTLGIHHRNRYNAYCLADDVMEPFRSMVDAEVWRRWVKEGNKQEEIQQEDKKMLLQVLHADVRWKEKKSPLVVSLAQFGALLVSCFEGTERKLVYPMPLFPI